MSIDVNVYVIAGYDLTDHKTDKYNDFMFTQEWENLVDYQRKGKIQLFDDPMSENYLRLGYIYGDFDDMCIDTCHKIKVEDFDKHVAEVTKVRDHLIDIGVVSKNAYDAPYEVIVFNEFR